MVCAVLLHFSTYTHQPLGTNKMRKLNKINCNYPVSILFYTKSGRNRPDRIPVITARYRFKQNAKWEYSNNFRHFNKLTGNFTWPIMIIIVIIVISITTLLLLLLLLLCTTISLN